MPLDAVAEVFRKNSNASNHRASVVAASGGLLPAIGGDNSVRRGSKLTDSKVEIELNLVKDLCANVPDLIMYREATLCALENKEVKEIMKFNGVLMFADVSGFTALTERYTQKGDKGVDRLTTTLNHYMGMIVECILESGGDVLKFAGDAFLALWKVPQREELKEALTIACKAAMTIQSRCDHFIASDVGVELRVKLAISAGNVYVNVVESEAESNEAAPIDPALKKCNFLSTPRPKRRRHFVTVGRPIGEVNRAEKLTNPGKIVLSPNAWDLCDKTVISGKDLGNRFYELDFLKLKVGQIVKPLSPVCRPSIFKDGSFPNDGKKLEHLRKAMYLKDDIPHLETKLREFVMPVVQSKLEDQQPLRYLSEMRQVTVLFINIAFRQKLQDKQFYTKQAPMIQRAFGIIDREVMRLRGTVNKLFMFDKGCSVLAVFGLPGSKHDGEAAHALQASFQIVKNMQKEIQNLEYCSIGITTGPVFVGVMGHPQRHEYTIIGPKVNMAARIMMNYPKIISCCQETVCQAKLAPWLFEGLPFKPLKGVADPGTIYHYSEDTSDDVEYFLGTIDIKEPKYPLLGRDEALNEFNDELFQLTSNQAHNRRVVLIDGEPGIGKTRLLEELAYQSQENDNLVVFATITITERQKRYSVVKMCLSLLFELNKCLTKRDRRKKLADLAGTHKSSLHLLNEVMGLDYEAPRGYQTSSNHDKEVRNLIRDLVQLSRQRHASNKNAVVFCLDDIHHVDEASWTVLTALAKDRNALIVCTVRPDMERDCCMAARIVFKHPNTKTIHVRPLNNFYLPGLICQMLNVRQISKQIKKVVQEKSHGVPFWCEQIIDEMRKLDMIQVRKVRFQHADDTRKNMMVHPEGRMLVLRNPEYKERLSYTELKTKQPSMKAMSVDMSVVPQHKRYSIASAINWFGKNRASHMPNGGTSLAPSTENLESPDRLPTEIEKAPSQHSVSKRSTHKGLSQQTSYASQASASFYERDEHGQVMFECVINTKSTDLCLDEFQVPVSVVGICIAKIDQMSPFKQLIVKCGGILGSEFSRLMLKKIMPNLQQNDKAKKKFDKAIKELITDRVLEVPSKRGRSKKITTVEEVSQISTLRFANPLFQQIAGDIWLDSQAMALHYLCVDYVKEQLDFMVMGMPYDKAIAYNTNRENPRKTSSPRSSTLPDDEDEQLELERRIIHSDDSNKKRKNKRDNGSMGSSVDEPSESEQSDNELIEEDNANSTRKGMGLHMNTLDKETQLNQLNVSFVHHGVVKLQEPILHFNDPSHMKALKKFCMDFTKNGNLLTASPYTTPPMSDANMNSTTPKPSSTSTRNSYAVGAISTHKRRETSSFCGRVKDIEKLGDNLLERVLTTRMLDNAEPVVNVGHFFEDCYEYEHNDHVTLARVYTRMVFHCKLSQDTKATLHYMIKCARALNRAKFPHAALHYAKDITVIIGELRNNIDTIGNPSGEQSDMTDDDGEVIRMEIYEPTTLEEAEAFSILGEIYFNLGETENSFKAFEKCLITLRCNILHHTRLPSWKSRSGEPIVTSSSTLGFNSQKQCFACIGPKPNDLEEKILLSKVLGFVFYLLNGFNALTNDMLFDPRLKTSNKCVAEHSREIIDRQLCELQKVGTMLETRQSGNPAPPYFIHLLLAQAYLNKYQCFMTAGTGNDERMDESLLFAIMSCRRLFKIGEFEIENITKNSSRFTMACQLFLTVATRSLYTGSLSTTEEAMQKALSVATKVSNYDAVSTIVPLLVQIYTHQLELNKVKVIFQVMYNMALTSRNAGLFAWYRALNLAFVLDIGRSFISVDDTVTLLFDIETDTVHYSLTCHIFIESVLACYHARKALGLHQHNLDHPSPSNMMKWRDAQQLVYRSINKAMVEIKQLSKTSQNFFRIKAMLYLLEAMLLANEIAEQIDEDLTPKIKIIEEKVHECHIDKRFPILQSRWLIVQSMLGRKNLYDESKKLSELYENHLDYEWAHLLGELYSKKMTPTSLKNKGHPGTPYDWYGSVRMSGLMEGEEKDEHGNRVEKLGSSRNVTTNAEQTPLRDSIPIHFFPYILLKKEVKKIV